MIDPTILNARGLSIDEPDYTDAAEDYDHKINVIGWLALGFVLGLLLASSPFIISALTSSTGARGASTVDVAVSSNGSAK